MERSRSEYNLDNIIKKNFNENEVKVFNKIYYGREDHCLLKLKDSSEKAGKINKFEVAAYSFTAAREETRKPRIVRLGLVQHSIVLSTNKPIDLQRQAIFDKVAKIIAVASSEGVKVLCLQETWSMPFFLCTGEKKRWEDFAECAETGPSVRFLSKLAKQYEMVIVLPILETDDGVWWNTAVVINENGNILGKHRKNHLPSVGSFSEIAFYSPGNSGHPVFETKYGKIAINICYGRHHALNWMMFAANGAEIVFNPAATISAFGEAFWGIEARNAAIANSFFTCSINRVGTESFTKSTSQGPENVQRQYYGSTYVTAPDGCRTPGLSRSKDGLMVVEIDLNLCRQIKDKWGFQMTARLQDYSEELKESVNQNF